MGDFVALIHNENIKIYRRLRTWIMLCILVLMSALFPMLVHFSSRDSEFSIGLWDSFQSTVAIAMFLNAIFTVLIAADSVAGEFF
ncbi:hypothetical protein LOS79_19620 [Paenibacillus sp. MMS20-IR301]|nr:hypothetical protein [Paenibacillus sp. MMS20-IR301]WNS47123.1 hypothetical protein LOS79_19620 [Paenibacillus sp. MMS20-IR301]